MSLTAIRMLLATTAIGLLLGGCGLTQRMLDGTGAFAHDLFYKQVKVAHLDFSARAALNTDSRDMTALSVPTLLRVYQLRERKAFDQAKYQDLLRDSESLLAADQLAQHAVVVKPDEGAQLNEPLSAEAQYVGVIALFRTPDRQDSKWRVVLSREDLDPDRARTLAVGENVLQLLPLPEE